MGFGSPGGPGTDPLQTLRGDYVLYTRSNLRIQMELFFLKLDVSSGIIPSITNFLFFQNIFLLSEVSCSHDVFLLLCSLLSLWSFLYLARTIFLFILLFNFSATEIFFFYLKEIILGDRICRVFMLNFFSLSKNEFLLRFEWASFSVTWIFSGGFFKGVLVAVWHVLCQLLE